MGEITIREVTEADDFNAIGEVYAQSWKVAYRGIMPQEYLDGLLGERWAKTLAKLQYRAMVALEDGEYVGTSAFGAARDDTMAGYGEIISIYLLPEHFGRGYAEPLLNAVENALSAEGYTSAYLWVLSDNARAIRFYEKQGFCHNGDVAEIEIAGVKLTECRYVKRLGDV